MIYIYIFKKQYVTITFVILLLCDYNKKNIES
jgi:hypothetical protein